MKDKKKRLPFKQRLFNKYLEKPITDILNVTYDLYAMSCRVYLDSDKIPTYEEYCQCVKDNLDKLYNKEV